MGKALGKKRFYLFRLKSIEIIIQSLFNNWQQVEDYRYEAALIRHYVDWKKGEECDQESKLKHLSHMLTNIAFLLYKEIKEEK